MICRSATAGSARNVGLEFNMNPFWNYRIYHFWKLAQPESWNFHCSYTDTILLLLFREETHHLSVFQNFANTYSFEKEKSHIREKSNISTTPTTNLFFVDMNDNQHLEKLVWKLSCSAQVPETFDLLCPKALGNYVFRPLSQSPLGGKIHSHSPSAVGCAFVQAATTIYRLCKLHVFENHGAGNEMGPYGLKLAHIEIGQPLMPHIPIRSADT